MSSDPEKRKQLKLNDELSFENDSLFADACALTARPDQALSLLSSLLERSKDPLERASVHNRLARIYQFQRKIQLSLDHAIAGLAEIKVMHPGRPLYNLVHIVVTLIGGLLLDLMFSSKKPATGRKLARYKLWAELSEVAGVSSYCLFLVTNILAITSRSLFPARMNGPSPQLVSAYVAFSSGMGALGLSKIAFFYGRKAAAIAEQIGDPFALARARLFDVYNYQFSGRWPEALVLLKNLLKNQA